MNLSLEKNKYYVFISQDINDDWGDVNEGIPRQFILFSLPTGHIHWHTENHVKSPFIRRSVTIIHCIDTTNGQKNSGEMLSYTAPIAVNRFLIFIGTESCLWIHLPTTSHKCLLGPTSGESCSYIICEKFSRMFLKLIMANLSNWWQSRLLYAWYLMYWMSIRFQSVSFAYYHWQF